MDPGLQTVIEGNAENGINHEIEPSSSNHQPLTNGNHNQEGGEDEKPATPKTPPAGAASVPPKEPEQPAARKTSSAASRSRSGSSRPTTGYGKTRTAEEQGKPVILNSK